MGLLLARLPLGVGVPLNLGGAPRSAVGVVDSVVSMGRALTPRPRLPLVRGSSSTWVGGNSMGLQFRSEKQPQYLPKTEKEETCINFQF